jgi:hypothetical protein
MTSVSLWHRRVYARSAIIGWLACGALSACSDTTDEGPRPDASAPPDTGGSLDSGADSAADGAVDEKKDVDVPSDAAADARPPDAEGPDIRQDARIDSNAEGGGQDAPRDGNAEGGDGACVDDPVWNGASLSFTFTRSGGFVPPPPPDAGCTNGISIRYDLLTSDRTLTQRGCLVSGLVGRVVYLTPTQFDAIIANIGSIRATCNKSCGADLPDMVLTVSASGVRNTYNSNFTAGCSGSPLLPPFVTYQELGALGSLLDATVVAACGSDAGTGDAGASDSSTGDAGSCMSLPAEDGGSADAPEGG